ncbi:MAG TPA: hypothetical protein DEW46_02740, partial [Verrucomicrobia bacterium]|nr:hypothetical protein [Verrucomicrobiota bacterium]
MVPRKDSIINPAILPAFRFQPLRESPSQHPDKQHPSRFVLRGIRKGLRIRMGRYPAEIAEGAEVYWEGGKGTYIGA